MDKYNHSALCAFIAVLYSTIKTSLAKLNGADFRDCSRELCACLNFKQIVRLDELAVSYTVYPGYLTPTYQYQCPRLIPYKSSSVALDHKLDYLAEELVRTLIMNIRWSRLTSQVRL